MAQVKEGEKAAKKAKKHLKAALVNRKAIDPENKAHTKASGRRPGDKK